MSTTKCGNTSKELSEKISSIKNLKKIRSDDISSGGVGTYTDILKHYVSNGQSEVFLFGDTIYGLIIDPPSFIVKSDDIFSVCTPKLLWFGYYKNINGQIVIENKKNIEDIMDILSEETMLDDLLFNLDLFA